MALWASTHAALLAAAATFGLLVSAPPGADRVSVALSGGDPRRLRGGRGKADPAERGGGGALMGSLDAFVATDLASGALWAATYLLILRRGARDRTSGVPLPALASAFAWELLYGVVHPTAKLPPLVVPAWLLLDAGILYQFLRYRTAAWTRRARAWQCAGVARGGPRGAGARARARRRRGRPRRRSGPASPSTPSCRPRSSPGSPAAADVGGQSMYIAMAKLAGSAVVVPHAARAPRVDGVAPRVHRGDARHGHRLRGAAPRDVPRPGHPAVEASVMPERPHPLASSQAGEGKRRRAPPLRPRERGLGGERGLSSSLPASGTRPPARSPPAPAPRSA